MTPQGPYNVAFSSRWADEVRWQYRSAQRVGYGTQFISALETIAQRVMNDPLTFGEPAFTATLGLEVRRAMIAPVAVEFGVAEATKTVLMRRVIFLRPSG